MPLNSVGMPSAVDAWHEKRMNLERILLGMIENDPGVPMRVALALFRFRHGVAHTTSYEYLADLVDGGLIIKQETGSTITLWTAEDFNSKARRLGQTTQITLGN